MRGLARRLQRVLEVTLKAIIACRCQRAAPTLTTVFEIAALTAPLIRAPHDSQAAGSGSEEGGAQVSVAVQPQQQPRRAGQRAVEHVLAPPVDVLRVALLLGLRLARGWAPAVVVAQGVRLVASLVHKRQHPTDDARQEGTEVRALQLGLSVVPRVDPRVPRSLEQYARVYGEWLLLLRGRLAQSCIELPEGLFEPGEAGDCELMRFALNYNISQARSLKDALLAMDRTMSNVREFAAWHRTYDFIAPADLEAWQRIAWWEGPDSEGHLWLMIDGRAAVEASRTHGHELTARVLVSNVEYGVRVLIPELGCVGTLRVVADTSDLHMGAALRSRHLFSRLGECMARMYPCRLHVMYIVGLPFALRWAFRATLVPLQAHTRRKVRLCRATEVPRRLPSQLRSHKLSVATGLDSWALLESHHDAAGEAAAAAAAAAADGGGSEYEGESFTPRTPVLVRHQQAARGGGGGPLRGLRWRGRGGSAAAAAARPGRHSGGSGAAAGSLAGRRRLRRRLIRGSLIVVGASLLLLLAYSLLLQQLVPQLPELVLRRLLVLLQRVGLRLAAAPAGGGGGGHAGIESVLLLQAKEEADEALQCVA